MRSERISWFGAVSTIRTIMFGMILQILQYFVELYVSYLHQHLQNDGYAICLPSCVYLIDVVIHQDPKGWDEVIGFFIAETDGT